MTIVTVVDKDNLFLENTGSSLVEKGYDVLLFSDYEAAYDSIISNVPDLLLLSIENHDLSIIKDLKQNPLTSNIQVIAINDKLDGIKKEMALGVGCQDVLSKPFDSIVYEYIENFLPSNATTIIDEENHSHLYNPGIVNNKVAIHSKKNSWHKILVVDDNPINTEILKELLLQINQTTVVAHNAIEALGAINEHNFDLILLDIMMPEVSGFDLIKKIKKNKKTLNVPVIFISALNETSDIVKGLGLGSSDYITKPFNIEEVKARVLSTLRIKDLQDKLLAEKTKMDMVFEYSADGIVMINSRFEIVSCNKRFSKWFDLDKKELIGHNFFTLINQNKDQKLTDEIILINNEKTVTLQVHHSKIQNNSSQTEGYVLILRDISAYKEIEKQKETFVATLTHDLKTPIRAEANALKLLLKGTFGEMNEEQQEIISETLNSNKYMFNMVDNLLSTYKYENGSVQIVKEKVDLNALIHTCYSELRYLFKDKKQEVILNFEQPKITGNLDAIEFKRVVTNILSNANKYTPENGIINITTNINDSNIIVSVQDNGKGIPEVDLSNLFTKYASYAHKFKEVGTGLGLYLSKKIIEHHNGTITASSVEGKGSNFTISIPVHIT